MEFMFGIENHEVYYAVSQEIMNNMYNFEPVLITDVEPHIIEAAKEELKELIKTSSYDFSKVSTTILSKGWNEERVNTFLIELDNIKTDMLYTMLQYHNSIHGETVSEFDWVYKMIMGSNNLKSLRYPLLQLLLTTLANGGKKKKTVYDINKDLLSKLIDILEGPDAPVH